MCILFYSTSVSKRTDAHDDTSGPLPLCHKNRREKTQEHFSPCAEVTQWSQPAGETVTPFISQARHLSELNHTVSLGGLWPDPNGLFKSKFVLCPRRDVSQVSVQRCNNCNWHLAARNYSRPIGLQDLNLSLGFEPSAHIYTLYSHSFFKCIIGSQDSV